MGNFSNYWDLTTLFTKIKNKLKSISDKIDDSVSLKTATGNPITLTDAANANAEELLMTIEPIQSGSGDPSPDNVRPISGISEAVVNSAGKNLLPMTVDTIKQKISTQYPAQTWEGDTITFYGITHTILHDGDIVTGIKVNGTSEAGYRVNFATFTSPDTKTYILNGTPAGLNNKALLYDNVGAWDTGSGASYNWERGHVAEIYFYLAGNTTFDNVVFTPMIRFATETDPTFEPYTAATATITFGQTVYGGSVNFKTGEVTVTHRYITVGDMLWSYDSASTRFGAVLSDMKYVESLTALPPLKCSAYKPLDITSFNTGVNNAIRSNDGGSKSVWIRDTRYTDATSFKTAMASTVICYELATPTTLTPTPAELELLKGNNTITANGAEISIEYYPDNAIGALAERVEGKADEEAVDEVIGDLSQTGLTGDSVAAQLDTARGRIATKIEGLVYAREDHTSLTARMDAITAQRKSGAYIMYCSSVNPDFATIGYCTAIGLTIFDAVSVIVAVNSQTGEIWTNGNTSQGAGAWRGWKKISADKRPLTVSSSVIGNAVNVANATEANPYTTPHEGFVHFDGPSCLTVNTYRIMKSSANEDYKGMWLPKGVLIYFTDGTPHIAQWFNCSNE